VIERRKCPICQVESKSIYKRPYSLPHFNAFREVNILENELKDSLYEIKECSVCGLHFQVIILEDGQLEKIYTTPSKSKILNRIETQKLHSFAHLAEEILVLRQIIGDRSPKTLDYGCAWGKWASMAQAFGCDSYGVEIDKETANFAQERGIKIISNQDLNNYEFDFINIDQVVEHLGSPLDVLKNVNNSLKRGGIIKISVPENERLESLLKSRNHTSSDELILNEKTLKPLAPLVHVNLFNNASLKKLGEDMGWSLYRPSLWKYLGAGQLWNIPRQINHNLLTPWKRWRSKGTNLWFQKT
jgi:2-polyprenyl-3-methyl-5-hydroxy-6-metoxy-1,4-benzoquinol methylase